MVVSNEPGMVVPTPQDLRGPGYLDPDHLGRELLLLAWGYSTNGFALDLMLSKIRDCFRFEHIR